MKRKWTCRAWRKKPQPYRPLLTLTREQIEEAERDPKVREFWEFVQSLKMRKGE